MRPEVGAEVGVEVEAEVGGSVEGVSMTMLLPSSGGTGGLSSEWDGADDGRDRFGKR